MRLTLKLARVFRKEHKCTIILTRAMPTYVDTHPFPKASGLRWLRTLTRPFILAVVLYVYSAAAVQGQGCPFPDSVAVTDTLRAEGYFPLHIGDTWEYKVTDSGFIDEFRRTEVDSDTLIGGATFYRTIFTRLSWNAEQSVIDRIKSTRRSYVRTIHTGLVFWTPEDGLGEQAKGFDRPFNSCFTDSTRAPDDTLVAVGGGYNRSFTVVENGSFKEYDVPAIKEVGGAFGSQSFAHGVGEIGGSAEVNVLIELLYAKVDTVELGTPMDSVYKVTVGSERPARSAEVDRYVIDVYPNPVGTVGQIRLALPEAGYVAMQIFDVLGRLVSVPLATSFQTAGQGFYTFESQGLAPGIYIVAVVFDGHVVSTSDLVLVQ